MEKLINNKNENNIMKKFMLICTVFILMFSSTYAVFQSELLRYEFEEGTGLIAFDTGNAGLGINGLITGASYTTDHMWGSYALDFDGNNDYVQSSSGEQTPYNTTVSFWAKRESSPGINTFWLIQDDVTDVNPEEHIHFKYHQGGGFDKVRFHYLATNGSRLYVDNFHNDSVSTGIWTHFVVTIEYDYNSTHSQLHYWRDGVELSHVPFTPKVARTNNTKYLRIAADFDAGEDFKGQLDDFRIFDFHPTNSQVSTLYASNSIPLIQEEPPINDTTNVTIIENLVEYDIIANTQPFEGSTQNNYVDFFGHLNIQASCQLYVDFDLVEEFTDVITYTHSQYLEEGGHNYYLYCYYDDPVTQTRYYEIQEETNFQVQFQPGTINFNIEPVDYDPNEVQLYITSPCLEKGITLGRDPGYQSGFNKNGAYFQPVINNFASVSLPIGDHEFCLFNGRIDFNTYNKTNEYFVGEALGNLNLGTFNVPNNLTSSYTIKAEQFDIYNKIDPKAWGKSWPLIISSVIAIVVGGLLVYAGMMGGAPAAIVIGGLLLLFGLGYQVSNLAIGFLFGG